ncbi:MAG: hypothetical protein DWH70_08550 [Planctomycetota bacterium]|nr:MAG: hypothetical protein DWH70_08550 [Planctomycetota bacterium]
MFYQACKIKHPSSANLLAFVGVKINQFCKFAACSQYFGSSCFPPELHCSRFTSKLSFRIDSFNFPDLDFNS